MRMNGYRSDIMTCKIDRPGRGPLLPAGPFLGEMGIEKIHKNGLNGDGRERKLLDFFLL